MELEDWIRWWKSRGSRELRSLLMEEWDPVGARDTPEAYDEYDSYIGQLGRKLYEGADTRAVAEYLAWVETAMMGLPAAAHDRMGVGESITAWYTAATRA